MGSAGSEQLRASTAGPAPSAGGDPAQRRRQLTYFALMVAASTVGLLKNLVYAKVLGVDELAYYGIVILTLQYGLYLANWGILNGLNYQLPVAYGRGAAAPEATARRALGALILTTAATALVYVGVVLAVDPADGDTRTALLLAAVLVSATTICEFYVLMLRVRRELVPLAVTFLVRAIAAVILGAAAGAAFGFEGVVAAEVASVVIVIGVAAHRWLPPLAPRRPNRAEATRLMWIGIPLTVANLAVAGTYTVDRLFAAGALPDQFGQYTFASIVVVAAFAISGILGQVVGPQILFEHGAGLPLGEVRRRMARITALIAVAAALGYVVLLGLIELAREGIFEQYGPGLDAMPILYLGAAFAVLNIYGIVLWAARRFVAVMLLNLLGTLVAIAGGIAVSAGDPSLEDFAWLFVAAQGASTAAIAVATEIFLRRSGREVPGEGDDPRLPELFD